MKHYLSTFAARLGEAVTSVSVVLEQPWRGMQVNADEVAQRRDDFSERTEHNFLWCWHHRGFW